MNLDLKISSIEVMDLGKCSNCNNETCYYDTSTNQYVCSEECYNVLNSKLNIAMNKIFERRIESIQMRKGAMKFLVECMCLMPKEAIAYLKDRRNRKEL